MKTKILIDDSDVLLEQEDFGILVTCATRYAIGRQSYMPYLVTSIVRPLLDRLDNKALGCLIRDIEDAPSLGAPEIDKPLWDDLLKLAKVERERRKGQSMEAFSQIAKNPNGCRNVSGINTGWEWRGVQKEATP